MPLFFYSLPNGRGGAFCIYRWGSVCWEVGIGATERALEGFLRGFEWFLLCLWGFLEVFWRFFATHKTRWLGSLVSGRVFGTLSRPCLCPTSPYFGLQTHFGICIVVWVAAARRKKRRVFFGVSPSQKRLNDFQLYSVLVSCLEESRLPVGNDGWV